MRIGIIGAATVGMTLAVKFADLGHVVCVASRSGPQGVAERIEAAGTNARAASLDEVLTSEAVFLAIPWAGIREVLRPDIEWKGRILVDATNIFKSYVPFEIDDLKGDSGSEIVARLAPSARVVKAFNTLPFATMFAPVPANMKRGLFVAGDDETAVSTVKSLIAELGLYPVALGRLAVAGRQMELGGPMSSLELLTPVKEQGS